MDEYDEIFEIEDHFDEQFADELEVLAEMEEGESEPALSMFVFSVCHKGLTWKFVFVFCGAQPFVMHSARWAFKLSVFVSGVIYELS